MGRQDHHVLIDLTDVDEQSRWVADADSYDTRFDQPWGADGLTLGDQEGMRRDSHVRDHEPDLPGNDGSALAAVVGSLLGAVTPRST